METIFAIAASIIFPLFVLFLMFAFRLYSGRNMGWVLLSLVWGGVGYLGAYQLNALFIEGGVNVQAVAILYTPIIQQILVALGIVLILSREKFDNLIDGAVYGWAAGLGFAMLDSIQYIFAIGDTGMEIILARSFATTLVSATSSAITGLVLAQYNNQHRRNRLMILFSGLGAAIGYSALFNLLASSEIELIAAVIYGISGLTLMSLYIAGQLRNILTQLGIHKRRADGLLDIVIPIGVNLTTEKNFQKLLENMLVEAKNFCNADAGTLYLKEGNALKFAVVRNDALKIAMGGTSGNEVTLPPVNLMNEKGNPNNKNVAAYAALTGKAIAVEDAYENREFDFSGTKEFDKQTGYISGSFLTIPLKNSDEEVTGVLQLINALDAKRKLIIGFDENLQQLMLSFSSLAAAALEGYIQEQNLRKEIQELKIEIDQAKKVKQVAEITDSSYFNLLQQKAKRMRDDGENIEGTKD